MIREQRDSLDEAYEERFVSLSERVERRLIWGVLILTVLLVISQGLLQFDFIRHRLTRVDRLEGHPTSFAPPTERVIY
jgi:hypothetical protein